MWLGVVSWVWFGVVRCGCGVGGVVVLVVCWVRVQGRSGRNWACYTTCYTTVIPPDVIPHVIPHVIPPDVRPPAIRLS